LSNRPKCQCRDGCPFVADEGQPFKLAHDPRPEMADARRAAMSEAGKQGAASRARQRAAAGEERSAKQTVRTTDGQLTAIDTVLRAVMRDRMDSSKRASAVATLVKVAREVLAADELQAENRDLRALIAERMPELRKHLKAIP
jgi:hypothetical protein